MLKIKDKMKIFIFLRKILNNHQITIDIEKENKINLRLNFLTEIIEDKLTNPFRELRGIHRQTRIVLQL